jgi:UDP-GlcNAc3NAcA epimerase
VKVITVLGARPQFVKAGVVSRALAKKGIEEVIVHTGQHFDPRMSDIFFDEMKIPKPAYNLEINSLGHGAMTGRMLEKIEDILKVEKPDITMVYGDTNSTLAGALAASKLHIPVAHVEAGLRSFDMKMPEEVNRILTDRISSLLFCPTKTAITNLAKEGYREFGTTIVETGDVMYDALLFYRNEAMTTSLILEKLDLKDKNFALVTVHRAENTDDPEKLQGILKALSQISKNIPVVWPIHPRTRKMLSSDKIEGNVLLVDPVGYFDMIRLLSGCKLVLTDSGGLQKEAYMMKKFCVTLRDQTEWTELVSAGVNTIAGADLKSIVNAVDTFSTKAFPQTENLYGDGHASEIIAGQIQKL